MGKESDPLPRGVWVAVGFLRIFAWCIIVCTNLLGLAPLVLSFFSPIVGERPLWLLDLLGIIVLVLLLIGFSMRTFADGLEQSHRHRGGVTDAVRWLGLASKTAGWMKWVSVGLLLTSLRVAAGSMTGKSETPLPTVLILLIVHVMLLAGMIFLSRLLKRRFQELLVLRPLAEPIGSRREAPPTLPAHRLPSAVPGDE